MEADMATDRSHGGDGWISDGQVPGGDRGERTFDSQRVVAER